MVQRWDFWLQYLECHWKRITAPPYPVSSPYRSKMSMALACMVALRHHHFQSACRRNSRRRRFFSPLKKSAWLRNWDEEFDRLKWNLTSSKWASICDQSNGPLYNQKSERVCLCVSVSESSCLTFWFNHFLSFHHNDDDSSIVWHDAQQQQQRHKLRGTVDHTAAAVAAA